MAASNAGERIPSGRPAPINTLPLPKTRPEEHFEQISTKNRNKTFFVQSLLGWTKCRQPKKAKPSSKPGYNPSSTVYSLRKGPCTCKPADSLHQHRLLTCGPKPSWSRPKSTAEHGKDGSAHFPASPGPSQDQTDPRPHTWAANGLDSSV